ncbi:hypothetical protein D210916BOD24_15760 [Alteromonas sp. D210916BOD_24]|uniref:DsrH/TusB family sulfur metabolism protein n=1 Tax=Alteromonas sp. D210916BOD_24 TaxID=3157618 RepID=UPI00399C668C
MIFSITKPRLTEIDKNLIRAAFTKAKPSSNVVVLFSGDGVYAQAVENAYIDALVQLKTAESVLYALHSDLSTRGVKCSDSVRVVTPTELASLMSHHQQWVVL